MRDYILALLTLTLLQSCTATKEAAVNRPLYEVLTQKSNGGAAVRFYEIISEPEEFTMIKSDPELAGKIAPDDIKRANFLILSAGEKPTGGYTIGIASAEETASNIIIAVSEVPPPAGAIVTTSVTQPYSVIRINSKKPIIIK